MKRFSISAMIPGTRALLAELGPLRSTGDSRDTLSLLDERHIEEREHISLDYHGLFDLYLELMQDPKADLWVAGRMSGSCSQRVEEPVAAALLGRLAVPVFEMEEARRSSYLSVWVSTATEAAAAKRVLHERADAPVASRWSDETRRWIEFYIQFYTSLQPDEEVVSMTY